MLFYVLVDNYGQFCAGKAAQTGRAASLLNSMYMDEVPFFANTPDDTHCVQASFRIMLKYFMPERDFSYDQLDKMSQKQPGKGTWWPPLLLEIQKLGFLVKDIESFDYRAFYKHGQTYVKEHFGPEVADYHLRNTNLMDIRPMIPEYSSQIELETRPATMADVRALLKAGWLVGLAVNGRTLNNNPGYVGHVVVIYEMDQTGQTFWLHDPGLPAQAGRKIDRKTLEKAWRWTGIDKTALVAVKLNEDS